jgi:hypothetical protein
LPEARGRAASAGNELQHQAWLWAIANRSPDGSLPTGKAIGDRFGRHERWGQLVKRRGLAGEADADALHAA